MRNASRPALDALDPDLLATAVSRRDALRRAGTRVAGLAIASAPLALGLMARDAFAQGPLPQAIRDVLNFALTLEYLEDEFYRAGLAAPGLIPATDRAVFQQIGTHETAHVQLLRGVLGSDATTKPTFDFTAGGAFGDVFTNYQTFLALSQGFEDTGVRAYKGQAGAVISDNGVLTTALQIHSVEARHAAQVRRMRGRKGWITAASTDVGALAAVYAGDAVTVQAGVDTSAFAGTDAATEAFDEPLTREAVLAIAGQFIVS
ncbi:MAG: ferritin-like domain-containing protein [Gemmatimonadales bacterium]